MFSFNGLTASKFCSVDFSQCHHREANVATRVVDQFQNDIFAALETRKRERVTRRREERPALTRSKSICPPETGCLIG